VGTSAHLVLAQHLPIGLASAHIAVVAFRDLFARAQPSAIVGATAEVVGASDGSASLARALIAVVSLRDSIAKLKSSPIVRAGTRFALANNLTIGLASALIALILLDLLTDAHDSSIMVAIARDGVTGAHHLPICLTGARVATVSL